MFCCSSSEAPAETKETVTVEDTNETEEDTVKPPPTPTQEEQTAS